LRAKRTVKRREGVLAISTLGQDQAGPTERKKAKGSGKSIWHGVRENTFLEDEAGKDIFKNSTDTMQEVTWGDCVALLDIRALQKRRKGTGSRALERNY